MKKNVIFFLSLVSILSFAQSNKEKIGLFKMGSKIDLKSNQKIFEIDSLILENNLILVKGSKIKLGNPVEPTKYNSVFIDKFSKSSFAKMNIGMWSAFPLVYKNSDFFVDEILLINYKGKQTPVINFRKEKLNGFTYPELSITNGEIIILK